MADLQLIRESLRSATLAAYLEEYKEQTETLRSLESKAQGSIAVAGIFIAGTLAYLEKLNPNLQQHERVLILIALVCLIVSVVLAILALRARTIDAPPLGSFVAHYSILLVKIDSEQRLRPYQESFFTEHVSRWVDVMNQIREANASKAKYLRSAQQWLIAAILSVAALSLSKVLA